MPEASGFFEGPAGRPLIDAGDAVSLVELCASSGSGAALLYASNLPEGFFDLSSGEAGEILQKLRNYRLRLAVVAPGVVLSERFQQLMVEERRAGYFAVFGTREEAVTWLG